MRNKLIFTFFIILCFSGCDKRTYIAVDSFEIRVAKLPPIETANRKIETENERLSHLFFEPIDERKNDKLELVYSDEIIDKSKLDKVYITNDPENTTVYNIILTSEGREALFELTSKNINEVIVIKLNNKVINEYVIRSAVNVEVLEVK